MTLKTNHDSSGFYDVKGELFILKSTKPLPIIFKLVDVTKYYKTQKFGVMSYEIILAFLLAELLVVQYTKVTDNCLNICDPLFLRIC